MWIQLDRSSKVPLAVQVYNAVRTQILEGKALPGEKLPSTRIMAKELVISRNSVLEAYEQLFAEGYIEGRQGSGTRVASGIQILKGNTQKRQFGLTPAEDLPKTDCIDFCSGVPALDLFPRKEWGRLLQKTFLEGSIHDLGYSHPEGRFELRRALAQYLFRARGIECLPEQILITTGATQAASLVARMLYQPGGQIIVEDPVNRGLLQVISEPGYQVHPLPVDQQGIWTEGLAKMKRMIFAYVTPSHQFPMGSVMSIQRRTELVRFAQETSGYILEDDYDSEYRYVGFPIRSIYSLDPERVIYIGSFSKILAPALRLGYVILPQKLLSRYRRLKKYTDVHSPSQEQTALARFIDAGLLDRHIAKMKKIYLKRQQSLVEGLKQYFGSECRISGLSTGLHAIAAFTGTEFTKELVVTARSKGVRIYPVEDHTIQKGFHTRELIMGYGHLGENEIHQGLERLKKVIGQDKQNV